MKFLQLQGEQLTDISERLSKIAYNGVETDDPGEKLIRRHLVPANRITMRPLLAVFRTLTTSDFISIDHDRARQRRPWCVFDRANKAIISCNWGGLCYQVMPSCRQSSFKNKANSSQRSILFMTEPMRVIGLDILRESVKREKDTMSPLTVLCLSWQNEANMTRSSCKVMRWALDNWSKSHWDGNDSSQRPRYDPTSRGNMANAELLRTSRLITSLAHSLIPWFLKLFGAIKAFHCTLPTH